MGKPYLKQVVKWRKNEAPEGLMQICVGTSVGRAIWNEMGHRTARVYSLLTYQQALVSTVHILFLYKSVRSLKSMK